MKFSELIYVGHYEIG